MGYLRDCLERGSRKIGACKFYPGDINRTRVYPSDTSDAEWVVLKPLVPAVKPGGRPARHTRRAIVDAVFYVNRPDCSWRSLPIDFSPWMTVYSSFRDWRLPCVYARLNGADCRHHRFAEREDLGKSNHVECQGAAGGRCAFQAVFERSMALTLIRSFRITATRATF